MKLLLLGANGQVGHELRRSLQPLGQLVCATRDGRLGTGGECERTDLADPAGIVDLVERTAPDVVVNAAAYTAVDRAEQEPELARAINAVAPGVLAQACAARGARLVHYSTDYVFDGTARVPYREDDPIAPLGVYGQTKADGEAAIRASGVDHLILRTAWVYGLHGHNFLRTMLRLGAERDHLRVVDDQFGSPTPAMWIADATAALLAHGGAPAGTFHLVTSGVASWHAFAAAIFDRAHASGRLARSPLLEAIPTSAYPTPARRPAYSVLDTAKVSQYLPAAIPEWSLALDEVFSHCTSVSREARDHVG